MTDNYLKVKVTVISESGSKSQYMVTAKSSYDAEVDVRRKLESKGLSVYKVRCRVVDKAINNF
ncbi:hypothetical protein [Staphylococcus aureus]|uniref:hypothetical protein n=1 Tax=Staphylococcus aureus TaxID=1280 RepID=UPI001CC4FCC7|nr:hypothetical protein [Staphylococcus aureus]MBZ5280793.1 hypothetical protein [Staphylococcus aureus]